MDWLKEYIAVAAAGTESPSVYHTWCGLTAVAASLKRRVWVRRGLEVIRPNLYVVLVGRPGIGKGSAIGPIWRVLAQAKTANILSDRVTVEFLLERLAKGWPTKGGVESSALIVSPELSIFITASTATLPILADLWDGRADSFEYLTRHRGQYTIKNPCLSLLGASTQEWLIAAVPHNAIGGGFVRRVNFVYSSQREKKPDLAPFIADDQIAKLSEELRRRTEGAHGEASLSRDAEALFQRVVEASEPGDFDDEATASYKTSLWAHTIKLATAIAVARDASLRISEAHIDEAYQLCRSVAESIPKVFRGAGESDFVTLARRIMEFLEMKGFAKRSEIIRACYRDGTAEDIDRVLRTLVQGNLVSESSLGTSIVYSVAESPTP
jgi:hypothetical protein